MKLLLFVFAVLSFSACGTSATSNNLSDSNETSSQESKNSSQEEANNSSKQTQSSPLESSSEEQASSSSKEASFRIIAYLPEYRPTPSVEVLERLTHLIAFSVTPTATGQLNWGNLKESQLEEIVTAAQKAKTSILLSVGGWGRSSSFSAMTASSSARKSFISTLVDLCEKYNLQGIDIDWEFPQSNTDKENYQSLLQDMKEAFSSKSFLVSTAVHHDKSGFPSDIDVSAVDFLNIMAYDDTFPHSSYSAAVTDLKYWSGLGFKSSQINLGVPFYGRGSNGATSMFVDLVKSGAPLEGDLHNGYAYNGTTTLKKKIDLLQEGNYGGMMIWEVGQDASGSNSLLTAIYDHVSSN